LDSTALEDVWLVLEFFFFLQWHLKFQTCLLFQFAKKNDKLPMNLLQKKKNDFPKADFPILDSPKSDPPKLEVSPSVPSKSPTVEVSNNSSSATAVVLETKSPSVAVEDVRIADLFVPLTSIKPGNKNGFSTVRIKSKFFHFLNL
jgi:hypothetical protein